MYVIQVYILCPLSRERAKYGESEKEKKRKAKLKAKLLKKKKNKVLKKESV